MERVSDDASDSQGNSLFHIACQNGNKRIAKLVDDSDDGPMGQLQVLEEWSDHCCFHLIS